MSVALGTVRIPSAAPPLEPWRPYAIERITQIRNPGPAQCFVFLDEREDSIATSFFIVHPGGLHPPPGPTGPANPAAYGLTGYPSSYHHGAGNLSFADGHAETHRWLDARTRPPLVKDTMLPRSFDDAVTSPGNPDVQWLQERVFPKQD